MKRVIDGPYEVKNSGYDRDDPTSPKDITIGKGWPEFASDTKMEEITQAVIIEMESLKTEMEANHYTKDEGHKSARSSRVGSGEHSGAEDDVGSTSNVSRMQEASSSFMSSLMPKMQAVADQQESLEQTRS